MDQLNYKVITDIQDPLLTSETYQNFIQSFNGLEELYYSNEWLKTWSPLYLRDKSLFMIVIAEVTNNSENIVAIFPFTKKSKRLFPGITITSLSFFGSGDHYSENPYKKVLIHHDSITPEISTWITNVLEKLNWDYMEFNLINPTRSMIDLVANTNLSLNKQISKYQEYSLSSQLILENGGDLYNWLPARKRSLIRKAERQLDSEINDGNYLVITEFSNDIYKEIIAIHSERQTALNEQGRGRRLTFEDKLERQTIKNILTLASANNKLTIHCIKDNQEMLGFYIMLSGKGKSYFYITAIKESVKKTQLGRYLWFKALDYELKKSNCSEVLLGYGGNRLKDDYSTTSNQLFNYLLLYPRISSRFKYRLFQILRKSKTILKKLS